MRIIIVSMTPTHPVIAGNRKFILEQTEFLKKMGHEVFFLYVKCLTRDKGIEEEEYLLMSKYWGKNLLIYKEKLFEGVKRIIIRFFRQNFCSFNKCDDRYPYTLHKYINKINNRYSFDACLVNYYFLSKILEHIQIERKGLITHDYFAYKNILMNDKHVDFNITANEEAKAMQRSPHIFALNDGEAEYFKRLSPNSVVHTIYCTYSYFPQDCCLNHKILFLSGPNKYNINGFMWFVNEVLPLLLKKFDDVTLVVGGAICDVLVNKIHSPNVELFGRVDDLYSFYKQGDIAINPTYQGTGIKIKTIESVAYDKVTVVHPHSKSGIFRKEKLPAFTSQKASEWVEFISKIWNDASEITKIKEKNKDYITLLNKHILEEYESFLSNQ